MKPFAKRYGEVSNHLMDWIVIWLNLEFEDIKCHVCSPYLYSLLRAFVESHNAQSLEVYIEWVHERYFTLLGLDITTLIMPYTHGKHWSVYVPGHHGFFHFNSTKDSRLHSSTIICTHFTKMWATRRGFDVSLAKW